ncbi:MAG: LLM class flavin-dependent oxidoreductase [Candidatus Tectomicrobia bacterium]|uniref:LLM class flavin-dependent oxidoreductase n=1 Tax=Tectimicrobiota bacterium TaxID=2528274 RepID=A0A938B2D3_UNCTE|nr:LLM class flavin-dependent oxidoreductase [Candidatus Tectomicrobia bacterium]
MGLQFGVFDHIEPVPGLPLDRIYRERLLQIDRLDTAGFYAYHLAEHHTPAVHSLAPSQNVFLASVAQRTTRLRFGPCVYVLPLHHPLRLIEEISMLDNLSNGRLEIGVGRGGVLEAHFWGQEADSETNYARYQETLAIILQGLSHDELTYQGRFHSFQALPMRLHPLQKPYPPLWYMRNAETAAMEGMHTILVGSLDTLRTEVPRYQATWEQYQGVGARTAQGAAPQIGLVVHLVVAETNEEAIALATPAWEQYRWNLGAPRRLEAEKRGLTQFLSSKDGSFGFVGERPAGLPARETRRDISAELERFDQQRQRPHPNRLGGVALAGSPAAVREYMDEYLATGANYFVCSFQWGDLTHEHAMQSIALFAEEVMPHYVTTAPVASEV